MKASMKRWWKDTNKGNRITGRDTFASATLFTTCRDFSILCCSLLDTALLFWKLPVLYPSVNSTRNIKRNSGMEHWWNDTGRGKNQSSRGRILALPLCPPQICPEIEEPATNRLSHGTAFDFATIDLTVCKDSIGTAQRIHPPSPYLDLLLSIFLLLTILLSQHMHITLTSCNSYDYQQNFSISCKRCWQKKKLMMMMMK